MSRRRILKRRRILLFSAVAATCLQGSAVWADSIYTGGGTGTASQPVSGNFSTGFTPAAVGSATLVLDFSDGAAAYTATNDVGSLSLNQIQLNPAQSTLSPATSTITGGTLAFAGTTPGIVQNNTGGFLIGSNLSLTSANLIFSSASGGTGAEQYTGAISSTGAFGLTMNGQNTVTLSGANTYAGNTAVNSGILALDYTSDDTNKISTAALTLAGGALTLTGNGSAGTSQSVSGLTLSGGSSITVTSGSTQNAALSLGNITRNPGGDLDFTLNSVGIGAASVTTSTANASFTGGQQTILGGYATFGGGSTWAVSGSGATAGTISALPTSSYSSAFTAGTDVDAPTGSSTPGAMTINSLRFNNPGAYTITSSGAIVIATGGILETSGVGNNAVTIGGSTLATGNGQDLIVNQYNTANTLTISSVIAVSGTAGLTKAGPGTLILSGVNTFTGNINIVGGVLSAAVTQLNNATAASPLGAGSTRVISLNNNATFQLTGNNTLNPQATVGVTFSIGVGGGTFDIVGAGAITLDDAGQFTSAGTLTKIGTGTLQVGNATAYSNTGAVNINAGTLKLVNSGTGFLNLTPLLTIASGATFDIDGQSPTRPVALNGAGLASAPVGALTNSIATAATVSGTVFLASAASIGGTGNITLSGNISGTPLLTKVGADTLTLSGTGNTYSGGTAVSAGTLSLSNASGSATGSGNVTLNATGGTNFISGAVGSMTGAVIAATSGTNSIIAPGGIYSGATASTFGSLTVGGLALTSNATTLQFDLSTPSGSNDLLTVTGLDSLIAAGANKVPILFTQTPATVGTYHLISFNQDGSGNISASSFSAPPGNGRLSYALQVDPGTGTQQFLDLIVTGSATPITANFIGTATPTSWTSAANWSSNPTVPGAAGDAVTFNNGTSAPASIQVTLDGQQRVGSLSFNNSGATSFTIAAGTNASVTPDLFLDNTPNAAPATLVNSSNNNTISALVTLVSPTNVTVTGTTNGLPNVLAISGNMNGTAGLTLTSGSTGVLALSGTNSSFTGGVTIAGGTVRTGSASALGTAAASVTAGGTLDLAGQAIANALTLNGTGVGGLGALINTSATAASDSGTVAIPTATTIGNANTITLSGVVSGSGALTKTGSGNLTFSNNANTTSGAVTINAGTLTLTGTNGGAGTIQTPSITVNAGANLVLTNNDTLGFNIVGRNALFINDGSVLNNGTATRDTISSNVTITGGIFGGTSAGGTATNAGAYSFNSNTGIIATSDAAGIPAVVSAPISYQGGNIALTVSRGSASPASDLNITAAIVNYNGATQTTGITKTGLGTLTLSGANTYTGTTLLNGGATVTSNAAAFGATAITVGTGAIPTTTTGNATLLVKGNTTIGTAAGGSLTVTGGDGSTLGQGTLSLADGTVNTLTFTNLTAAANSLNLGSASNPAIVNLELGTASGSSDKIVVGTTTNQLNVLAGGTVNGTAGVGAILNIFPTGAIVAGTYTLLSYGSETSAAANGGFAFSNGAQTETLGPATLTLSNAASAETLTVTTNAGPAPTTAYFQGSVDANWNTIDPNVATTNFTSDSAGTTNTLQIPGAATDVHFYAANATTANLATSLGQNFTIDSLTLDGGALTQNVSIASGGSGGNTLTIAPASPTIGITLNAGAGSLTITSPLTLGAPQTWTNNSSSLLTVSGPSLTWGAFSLTVTGSGNTAVSAPITGSALLTKSGAGTLTLGGANFSTGGTAILGGTVQSGIDNALGTTALTFGAANTANFGSLNLATFNQTLASLTVLTNSTTLVNTVTVSSGKTLTLTNGLTLGYDASSFTPAAATTSRLAVSGAGGFNISGGSVTLGVGQATVNAANNSTGTLDLSGLTGPFTASVTAFNVGFGATAAGNLTLGPGGNTITTPLLNVGNSNAQNGAGNSTMTLGAGANVIKADTINIGFSKVNGTIAFASEPTPGPGSVTITNSAGTGGAALNVGSQNATGTGAVITGTLDLRGHASTVTAGVVTIGNNNNTSTGSTTGILNFDTGTFNATSLNLGLKSGAGTGTPTTPAALNLSGGSFTVSGATTIAAHTGIGAGTSGVTANLAVSAGTFSTGSIVGATKNSATNTGAATGNINVSGTGAVVVGTGGFSLATEATAGTAVGALNITGGSVTSNSDITKGGGAATATITLNGGVLDLTGHNIGNATTSIDTLNFQTGTLQNVAQINNGAALAKSATGTLILAGSNAYTGPTNITGGTFLVNGTHGAGTNLAAAYSIASPATLGGTGTINLANTAGITIASGATLAPGGANSTIGTLTVNAVVGTATTAVTLAAGSNFNIALTHTAADELIVNNGSINLGGATLNLFQNGSLQGNEQFTIVDPAGPTSIIGAFAGGLTGTSNGIPYTLAYNTASSPETVTLTVGAVPEPASFGIISIGALGLLARRRRRVHR